MTTASHPSFNQAFCTALEFRLGEALQSSGREDLKGFWCDGVSHVPEVPSQVSKKSINDTHQLTTKAWLGKTGQDEYEMTIVFGKYSLRRYAKGSSMTDCIPTENTMDWVEIDIQNKKITVYLL